MESKLSELKVLISQIDGLKNNENWGVEFQLWLNKANKLTKEIFGEEGLALFDRQKTMTTSYIDESFNIGQYRKELDNRKKVLESLLDGIKETISGNYKHSDSANILKEIWKKEEALKENLLPASEVDKLHSALVNHLEKTLNDDSIPSLRFKKIRAGRPITWWSNEAGYPVGKPWEQFKPFLELLEQYEAGQTIKNRFEAENLFVESRSQGEDLHLLIGKRDGTSEKAHVIIDGKTGEIRTKDNAQEPTDLVSCVEATLTLPSGKRIKTTREAIQELP